MAAESEVWEVSLVLYPSTGEDSLSQFVRFTLTLTLDLQYPSSPPSISIHNPLGLSDDKLCSLSQKAKEILTESNIPHGNCVICLYGFKDGEAFTKTRCYRYFNSHCLGRYITHSETELQERGKELEQDKTRERTDEPPPNSDNVSADGNASPSRSLLSLPPASTNQITAPKLQHAGHSRRRGGRGHQYRHQVP
ncbi:E3 ubiquitin-protein ligase RNF25-like [Oncorhynchus keta]|uniref:E3 ubiquitin-protein ligase RNF25-like n=1 Tax=Oncorhynchus keta TaxID=8018 RepID=UPI00227B14D8|nr:E3 ubiquitin-protein ligase RNF25-like [Oncorhynchus keta]